MNQNQIFMKGEGDAWFNRNHSHIQTVEKIKQLPDVNYLISSLNPYRDRIDKVLEIGCSNGIKLEVICNSLDAIGTGIEPSTEAVNAGNNREKVSDITLHVGTGESLPFKEASFDLVYFAFCLYLFDRTTLMQSLAEADRVLKPGGFLVITDFDPGVRYKKTYSHFDGVFSYKQDYSSFYLQSGLYYLVGKHSFSHRVTNFDESQDERVSTLVLYKEIEPYPFRG
jgi:ubiquinone/menaquinone biosynthesis C-methylase UbiE